jgi:hypothetical protein
MFENLEHIGASHHPRGELTSDGSPTVWFTTDFRCAALRQLSDISWISLP